MHKFWLSSILVIILVSLLILAPSFKLALTGDDYLGFWRYHQYLNNPALNLNPISFLLTDYGPQDTLTVLIHHFFGFQHIYFYIVSYLLRLISALTFLPLIFSITKNRWAAFFSALFFSITTTGLETTDWSFNMPSYLAIAVMNIFILVLLKSKQTKQLKYTVFAGLLFMLTILVQPIRMIFLPLLVIGIELITILFYRNKQTTIQSAIQIFLYILLFGAIFIFGMIGESTGAGRNFQERINEGGLFKSSGTFQGLIQIFKTSNYQYLLHPFAQIGYIIYPYLTTPDTKEYLEKLKTLLTIGLPTLLISLTILLGLYNTKVNTKIGLINILLTTTWTLFTWYFTVYKTEIPVHTALYFAYLLGGYFIFMIINILFKEHKEKQQFLSIIIFSLLVCLPFIMPWFRDPNMVYESTGRYLVISAAGLAALLGVILSLKTNNRIILVLVFIFLLLTHAKASNTYLYRLSELRNVTIADKIRSSVKYPDKSTLTKPTVYYFKGDTNLLHHTLIFGFPMFMAYYHDIKTPWNFVYTEDWKEVESAVQDGESLKRFSIKSSPVELDHIYSYKLEGDNLVDTSIESRNKLKNIINEKK